jgi:hypothetical protein
MNTDTLWYLSFADGDKPPGEQWLGAAIVRAPDLASAVSRAWAVGANPGGEVASVSFTLPVPPEFLDRLLDRQGVEGLDRALRGGGDAVSLLDEEE